jgi:hypothetical protein
MADLRGMPADLSRFYPPPLTLAQLREGWLPLLAPAQLKDALRVWDEPPFIGLDEGELDPMMDAARLLEQTGERWLSFSEAVALLREREPMSIGHAEHILDDLRVAYLAGGGPFARQSGKSAPVRCYFVRGIGLLGEKPHRENTFVSEADLIYWLDQNRPAPKSAPSPQPSRTPAQSDQPRKQPDRDRARQAALAIWGSAGPPNHMANPLICRDVAAWLKHNGQAADISDATILRAVGRK